MGVIGMTFKRAVIMFLLILLLISTVISPIHATESNAVTVKISDIENHWASTQLTKWVENGLINGYEDGTVRPDHPITRAEFVTIVNRIFKFIEKTDGAFTDVRSDDWF